MSIYQVTLLVEVNDNDKPRHPLGSHTIMIGVEIVAKLRGIVLDYSNSDIQRPDIIDAIFTKVRLHSKDGHIVKIG